MNPLGLILLLSHPRALTQPSCNGAGRRNRARGSFEGRFWGSSMASAATSRTRRGYGLLPSASCTEAAALEKVGSGGFFSQGEFCCSFARGEGVFAPQVPLPGWEGQREVSLPGEMWRPRSAMAWLWFGVWLHTCSTILCSWFLLLFSSPQRF